MDSRALLIAIVQQQDADLAIAAVVNAGLRVTRLGSTGGFLQTGNVTLLMELKQTQVARALALLKETCVERASFVNAAEPVMGVGAPYMLNPVEVLVGGATIFVLPVERTVRVGAGGEERVSPDARTAGTKLLVAIAAAEHANKIVAALIRAQYRATLISSAGGFWRKGNATLLMGVPAVQVNDVIACIARALPHAHASATIFVLNVERCETHVGA